jgi:hypothetical protein
MGITVLSRDEFAGQFPKDLAREDGPLWSYEKEFAKQKCLFFLKTTDFRSLLIIKNNYWDWCREHLQGQMLCYSFGESEQWWGFTNEKDIALWMLKWL